MLLLIIMRNIYKYLLWLRATFYLLDILTQNTEKKQVRKANLNKRKRLLPRQLLVYYMDYVGVLICSSVNRQNLSRPSIIVVCTF